MKIRTGFVSNSSSSSFVFITTKEAFDEVFAKITEPPIQQMINKVFTFTDAFGKKLAMHGSLDIQSFGFWDDELEEMGNELSCEDPSEILYSFIKDLKDIAGKDNYIENHIDM